MKKSIFSWISFVVALWMTLGILFGNFIDSIHTADKIRGILAIPYMFGAGIAFGVVSIILAIIGINKQEPGKDLAIAAIIFVIVSELFYFFGAKVGISLPIF